MHSFFHNHTQEPFEDPYFKKKNLTLRLKIQIWQL